jgi:hypothetical protein
MLMTLLALTALAVGLMGLLTRFDGHRAGHFAKQPAVDMVPALVLIALHEPSLRSMIGRRVAAPSRAPPFCRHLVRLTVPPSSYSAALPDRLDSDASFGA